MPHGVPPNLHTCYSTSSSSSCGYSESVSFVGVRPFIVPFILEVVFAVSGTFLAVVIGSIGSACFMFDVTALTADVAHSSESCWLVTCWGVSVTHSR